MTVIITLITKNTKTEENISESEGDCWPGIGSENVIEIQALSVVLRRLARDVVIQGLGVL